MSDLTEERVNELLAALEESRTSEDVPGALTAWEVRRKTGWGEKKVRWLLDDLIDAGKVEIVWVGRTNKLGQAIKKPAYRVVNGIG